MVRPLLVALVYAGVIAASMLQNVSHRHRVEGACVDLRLPSNSGYRGRRVRCTHTVAADPRARQSGRRRCCRVVRRQGHPARVPSTRPEPARADARNKRGGRRRDCAQHVGCIPGGLLHVVAHQHLQGSVTQWIRRPDRAVEDADVAAHGSRKTDPASTSLTVFSRASIRHGWYFFSVRRGTDAAEHAIRTRGFEEVRRKTGNVSARLIEYRRTGPPE